jgi:pimeloyl-ACP methyl ester carboxylesterase
MKIIRLTIPPFFFLLLLFSLLTSAQILKADVDEFTIQYEVKGHGEHTLLLEAGYADDMSKWDPIFSEFSKITKTIRYTRVGNELDGTVKRQFSAEEYAKQLDSFLQKIGVKEPVVIIAHSYSPLISRMFAATYPERVEALLFLDPNTEKDVDIMRSIDVKQTNKAIEGWKLEEMKLGMKNSFLDFWSKRPMPSYPNIKDMPVTVIVSSKKYTPTPNIFFTDSGRKEKAKWHKEWAESFPQGRVKVTTKSRHYIHYDEPELVVEELQLLLRKLMTNKATKPE